MNIVREAVLEDLDDLVVLCEKSFIFSGCNDVLEYDGDIARKQCEAIITNPDGFMVVLETGSGIKGVFAAHIFNGLFSSSRITHEGFLYIDEDYRGGFTIRKFMKAYNEWGESNGAVMQVMVSHEDHDKFEKFYSLYGYKPSERTYLRKL